MKVFLCGNMPMVQIFNELEFWTELKQNSRRLLNYNKYLNITRSSIFEAIFWKLNKKE